MGTRRAQPRPDDQSVFAEVARIAELHPDRIALSTRQGDADVEITYGQLVDMAWRDSERLAALGIGPGSRVALFCENRPEWLRSYLAISASGASTVAIEEETGAADVRAALESARPRAVIGSAAALARLAPDLRAALHEAGAVLLDLEHALAPLTDSKRAAA